jgi:uncharacterized tellurite resistance protein B-like protein
MEFRPFWEILEKLGISLPNPAKIRDKQQGKATRSSRSKRVTDIPTPRLPSNAAELLELLNAIEETDVEVEAEIPPARQSRVESRGDFWVPPGKTTKVAGYEIPGMVYVGEGLSSINNVRASETSLINPQLRVKRDRPDIEGKQMPYSTSYSQMPPACRAAYLDWLSTGRCHLDIYIGYIWLFFHGLERRVFHDLLNVNFQTQPDKRQELDQIVAEVERLNKIYGGQNLSGGIRYKVETFLDICQVMRSADLSQTIDPSKSKSLLLQVGLGQWVEKGKPIPADWALAWYSRLSSFALPMAASRCPEEFQALFRLRYAQKYGEGMKLKSGKSRLTTVYYPASQSFWGRAVTVPIGNLPDVTRFAAKVRKIGEVIETCRTELEPLSRFLGRNPDSRHTHSAIALLPGDLLSTHGGDLVKQLQHWLKQVFSDAEMQVAVISGQDLLQHWSGANPEKLTKTEATGLSKFLELLGYGIEPDLRLGGAAPTLKNQVALFRLSQPHPATRSDQYVQATLVAHLAIAVASGTEAPSPIEREFLESYLKETVDLEAAERSRLQAHIHWLVHEKPTLRSLKARIEPLEPPQRGAIAQLLVRVAAADGQINPQEVQMLEKAYILLGRDSQTLYSDIHDLSTAVRTAATEPITVRKAAPRRGHAIPPKPGKQQPAAGLTLDMTLVQSKLVESQEISNLLADIFVDEDGLAAQKAVSQIRKEKTAPGGKRSRKKHPDASAAPTAREIAGLDADHSALLLALNQRPIWQRAELEAIAASLNLMLDGALEVINEAAFDHQDEAVVEGHDSIEVNVDVLRELLA